MKEKLTLEHLAPYLPYGLMVRRKTGYDYKVKGVFENFIYYQECASFSIENCKPILRKMDLTKPIKIDGKEVIPIMELVNIAFPDYGITFRFENGICENIMGKAFDYFEVTKTFNFNGFSVDNQLALFKWLFANKFDVDGLIYAGLAIDVNTLEINPYE